MKSRGQVVFVAVTKLVEEEAHELTVAVRIHTAFQYAHEAVNLV